MKKSTWGLTFNSQLESDKLGRDKSKQVISKLEKITDFIQENINDFIITPSNFHPDDITSIRFRTVFANGKNQNKLHAHSILEISHNSRLKLDFKRIQEVCDTVFGYRIYFNARLLHRQDDIFAWEDYMSRQ